ncbi:hypothetical protein BJY00DRAFT_318510 [Aspergillus carlsbadensis]|nr:hypothetical protein BJY00DRAFT_318510 [Aspergillus carlsbadensis]
MPRRKSPYPGTTYHIAWICSTTADETAALSLLDKTHGSPREDREPTDACSYTTGRMAGHRVVIVCMHADRPQPFSADNIVHNMRYTFPNLRFAMLVGVGAAMPKYGSALSQVAGGVRDVRLGDVVVGCQKGKKEGVVVYEVHNNGPVQTRTVNNRPTSVTKALSRLEAQRAQLGRYIEQSLAGLPQYTRPPHSSDPLPKLMGRDAARTTERANTSVPLVHFGTIASAKKPREIPLHLDGHCVESEAASLQSEWPCVVIRGMAEYWGGHPGAAARNGGVEWRAYARASAAAMGKIFLQAVREEELKMDRIVIEESLSALPPELLSRILTWCIPRNTYDGEASISLWDHDGEADLRLVCQRFDSTWSHRFVWEILNQTKNPLYTMREIHKTWPVDSTIWFVRTLLVMRYRPGHPRNTRLNSSSTDNSSDNNHPSALEYIYAMVEAVSCILPQIQPDDDRVGVIARAIARVAMALVLNHEVVDIVPDLEANTAGGSDGSSSRMLLRGHGKGADGKTKTVPAPLSWEIQARDILPLLCLTSSSDVIHRFLSREREKGSDVDITTRNPLFGSPLYNASATNNPKLVTLLLEKGADVNATGGRWYTPLHASVAYPTGTESLTLLLAAGADVNAHSGYSVNEGRTPVITASHAQNTEGVSILLAHREIDVSILAMSDESIAHYIARAGDATNLKLLLELHPNIDIKLKGEYGTPLHTAMNFAWDQLTQGHDAVVEILLERGLSPRDTCPGAERDVVGWAEEVINEAREEGREVPGAAGRVMRWYEEYAKQLMRERRGASG